MIYASAEDWRQAPHKRICLFGMSGLGKTHLAKMLRGSGTWYHYSVDYRIGTRYLGEAIVDEAKHLAMQVPQLRQLLLGDSIFIGSNIGFENLAPLSAYLGKPGDPAKGGLPITEYQRRQALHRAAEIAAMQDTQHFITRAQQLYGYAHFVCDTSGSVCEVTNPEDPQDPVMSALAQSCLPVWLRSDASHIDKLVARFDRAPKPMYYQPAFLADAWDQYLAQNATAPERVDPDAFMRWTYARALDHRQPLYEAMARWGVTLEVSDVARVEEPQDLIALIGAALDAKPLQGIQAVQTTKTKTES